MLKIAVCDDEKALSGFLKKQLDDIIVRGLKMNAEITSFCNSEELMKRYESDGFDVLFLDIDMPGLSGFDVAERIRNTSVKTAIIFVTSKTELVYNSFDYQPFYFICKQSGERFRRDLEKAVGKLVRFFSQNKTIEITDTFTGTIQVPLEDIIYIQSEKHYLLYHVCGRGEIPIKERGVLSTREEELRDCDFLKTHNRYLINLKHLCQMDTFLYTIVMTNGDKIPISKRYKNKVIESYRLYRRG